MFVDSDGEVIEDRPAAVGIGTGEGLAKALRPTGDDDEVPTRINLTVPEIGTLGAIAARQGATVIGELLKAYMGQALGSPMRAGRPHPSCPRTPTGCVSA